MPVELTVSTDELIQRAQGGDLRSFETLYRMHVGRTYALALRMVGDAPTAEEVVQDIWVRAWQRLDSFNGESAFSTWLHRLAVNLTIDHLRSHRRRESRSASLDDPRARSRSARPDRPGDRLDLERAIAGLPEGARTVFVLHEVEGLPCRDVAEVTGTAVGTVKSQLFRARQLLREALAP